MKIVFQIIMFTVPIFFALFLTKNRDGNHQIRFKPFMLYFILINSSVYCISYFRGVKEISFHYMTYSYCIKWLALGIVFAIFYSCGMNCINRYWHRIKTKDITWQDVWKQYLSLWQKLIGWKLFLFYVLHYTILFFVLHHFVFASFVEEGKSFVWYTDGVSQHFARLLYISQLWRENISSLLSGQGWSFPLYDFSQGPALMDTQMGLPQLLAVFWPSSQMDSFYTLYVLSNYYATGLAFSVFGFYWKQNPLSVLIGAVSYTFSAMALYSGVRHPHFIVPMILLPLLLTSVEQILQRKRAWLFPVAVFFSLTTQWGIYFSCMQIVFVSLYVAVRFFDVYPPPDRSRQARLLLARLIHMGTIPVLLSAVSWLPALINILGSGRVGNSVDIPLYYKGTYYKKFLESFILNPSALGSWTLLGFSVLTLPAVILLFLHRKKEGRALRILFLILTVMLCIPAVAYVMSGFSNVSNRFCFGYAFCVAAILMFMTPHLVCLTRREFGSITAGIVVYFVICYFGIEENYFDPRPILLLVASVLFLVFCHMAGARRDVALLRCLLVTCFSVCYSAYWLYDTGQNNYVSEFVVSGNGETEKGQYAALAKSKIVQQDADFYRVSGNSIQRVDRNSAFHYDLNGFSMYPYYGWSTSFVQWLHELEVSRKGNLQMVIDLDSRAPLLTLAGVKYFANREGENRVSPYGFEKVDSVKRGSTTDRILSNTSWLPIGYTYDHYMLRDTYNELNALDRQEAELSAVLLEETPTLFGLQEAQPEHIAQQIPYEITESNGLTWENGTLKVNEKNATLTLTFEGLPQTETYLRIVELHMSETISVVAEQGVTSGNFYADSQRYANGQTTQTLNLGYSEDRLTTITIKFPTKATGRLDDIQIWCQPMEHYTEQVTALGQETLQNVTTDWHSLRGKITVNNDKVLCLAIPYADGWTAYVDGQKTALYQANTAFMAVELSPGAHTVELRYWMPGLTLGLVMSCAGVVGLIAQLVIHRKKHQTIV